MAWLRKNREKTVLILILLLTAFLTSYKIWEIGDANAYYTAAVQSMLKSWDNFFYASFDPVGFISVDKPALGLWLECLFALIFGVHGWSVTLPQILCSIVSVAVLYNIIKRSFGSSAGLLAAFFLALTPIFIAATRTNNFDASLVMVCLLAVRAAVAAAEKGSLKHLILSMVLIGIGFNIKMLQAFLYLPAIYLVYFFTSKASFKKRILHLLAASVILVAVSASWCLAVDLTPTDARPYVGSSDTNSALELAFGYNGLARVFGTQTNLSEGLTSIISSDGGSAFMDESGTPGLFRLFNAELAGQISWMLVLAVFGILALVLKVISASKEDKKAAWQQLLLWSGLFITMYAFFSVSRFFHRYYLIMLAPCLAALSAIAVREGILMFTQNENNGKNRWLNLFLPISIIMTAAVQIYFLIRHYTAYSKTLVLIIALGTALSLIGFVLLKVFKKDTKRLITTVAAIGIVALLAAPAYWAYSPILSGSNASLPYAGPSDVSSFSAGGAQNGGSVRPDNADNLPANANGLPDNAGNLKPNADANNAIINNGNRRTLQDEMIRYIIDSDNGARILLVVANANIAAPILLEYDINVIAIGGFSGGDIAVSLEDFIELVKNGEIQYFLVSGNTNSVLSNWVTRNGKAVDTRDWLQSAQAYAAASQAGTLYDLSGLAVN